MIPMKAFQPRRFARMMAWTLRGERKNWITMGMVSCAVFLTFLAYAAWDIQGESPLERWDHIKRGTILCLGTSCGILMVCSSQFIAHLKTKEQRLAYLSLPASTLEKYLSRLLYVGVLMPLTLPVAMVVADALASLFALTLGDGYVMEGTRCAWLALGKLSAGMVEEALALVLYAVVGYVALLLALLTLCSVVFRQGMAASAACLVVVLFATGMGVEWLSGMGPVVSLSDSQARLLLGLAGTFFLAAALLAMWLSYRVYRRLQVVPGKFTNL